jgi:NADPH-dependent ferric siderophore reductase
VVRNYTVRAWRSDAGELDVDFVQHGDAGVAGPWAATAQAGAPVGLIDQGRGFEARPGDTAVLTGDESALPAIAGILRDLPSDARGDAIVELFDADDRQDLAYPAGVTVHWLTRPPDAAPGAAALPALRDLDLGSTPRGGIQAFAAGESALATAARRHLVNERGVPRSNVTFCGYWKWSQNA